MYYHFVDTDNGIIAIANNCTNLTKISMTMTMYNSRDVKVIDSRQCKGCRQPSDKGLEQLLKQCIFLKEVIFHLTSLSFVLFHFIL